jgi:hypothetical protein
MRAAAAAVALSSRRRREPAEKPVEQLARVSCNAGELGRGAGLAQADDEVERVHRRPTAANRFAQHALEAVTIDGAPQKLLADHVADAAAGGHGRHSEELQPARFKAAAAAEDRGKSRGAA